MNFDQLLERRYSCRNYTDTPLSEAEIRELITAANCAPVGSARYMDLHLTVVQDKKLLMKLTEALFIRVEQKKKEMEAIVETVESQKAAPMPRDPYYGAPVMIFISHKKQDLQPGIEWCNVMNVAMFIHLKATEMDNSGELVLQRWTSLIHPACAIAVFIVIAVFSLKHGEVKASSSDSIEYRIQLSAEGLRNYPVNLFGHDIEERGAGGVPDTSKPYFYLDISYVRFPLKGGLVVLVVYLILIMRASRYAAKHNVVLALALVVVAVESMIEQHALGLAYNVLIGFGMGEMMSNSDLVLAN